MKGTDLGFHDMHGKKGSGRSRPELDKLYGMSIFDTSLSGNINNLLLTAQFSRTLHGTYSDASPEDKDLTVPCVMFLFPEAGGEVQLNSSTPITPETWDLLKHK